MITIRPEQMARIADARLEVFLLEHVERYFPEQCSALGRPATQRALRETMREAMAEGWEQAADVCAFVDITFVFGRGFARNPGLPWAAPALAQACLQPPGARGAVLHAHALAALEAMEQRVDIGCEGVIA
jgi:hypothetical protein